MCAGPSRENSRSHQQDGDHALRRQGRLYLVYDQHLHLKPGSTVDGSDMHRQRSEGTPYKTAFGKLRYHHHTLDLGTCSHQNALKRILVPEWILRLLFCQWLIDVNHEVCTQCLAYCCHTPGHIHCDAFAYAPRLTCFVC